MLLLIESIVIIVILCKNKKASRNEEAFYINFNYCLINYLNAGIPVISAPVINKWMSCVPS